MRPIVVIPARMASARLPGKPLADIAGEPMIVHVWRRAVEAAAGPVLVAAAEPEIADAVTRAGGRAVLTDPVLPSGSDRVHAALAAVDPHRHHDVVINLQGDLPDIAPRLLHRLGEVMSRGRADIATLAVPITSEAERDDPHVVKALVAWQDKGKIGTALTFTRRPPRAGSRGHFHHIGVYAYRRVALDCFVTLPPSPLEKRERLEQLRALEAGMIIEVALVDTVPTAVDTPADLERVRRAFREKTHE